ncbi:MAG: OsmC family protein [Halobacteriota archaeon]
MDEPEWIPGGNDTAPWPSNYLLVACAGCQVEVITQALEKARIDDYDIDVEARFETQDLGPELEEYPDHLSWRYTKIIMDVEVETNDENEEKVRRLLDLAEDACIVSRSVERGVDFDISKDLSVRTTTESK